MSLSPKDQISIGPSSVDFDNILANRAPILLLEPLFNAVLMKGVKACQCQQLVLLFKLRHANGTRVLLFLLAFSIGCCSTTHIVFRGHILGEFTSGQLRVHQGIQWLLTLLHVQSVEVLLLLGLTHIVNHFVDVAMIAPWHSNHQVLEWILSMHIVMVMMV